jgi:signal transduction histidine kinase
MAETTAAHRRLVAAALVAAGALASTVALQVLSPDPLAPGLIVVLVAIGGVWFAAGLVAWARRPAFRTGPLMLAAGFLWLGLTLYSWHGALSVTFAQTVDNLGIAVVVHLFVAFPTGYLTSRTERLLVLAAYADAVLLGGLLPQLFRGPEDQWCDADCGPNLLLVRADPDLVHALEVAAVIVAIGIALAVAWLLWRRWRAASATGRAVLGPVLWTGAAAVLSAVTVVAALWAGADTVYQIGVWVSWGMWGLVPAAFLLGLLGARLRRGAVASLMVELGELPPAPRVRDALADALGDPSLELYFWSAADVRYVGLDGQPARLPTARPERAVTVLDHRGERYAALVHDPFLLEDRELLEGVGAAARLAIENARLQAELRAQLEEVRASRARIVEAGDAERRRIERDLHDGAQQRLLGIRLALRLARRRLGPEADEAETLLAEADEEMRAALEELRSLARGIHPAVLTDEGLPAALTSLARRALVPTEVLRVPSERLPAPVEAATYFLTSEALANVAKHAHASRVTIDASLAGGWLRVEIADDGAGGADDSAGSGLSGLRDRVEALGGRLSVDSPRGGGTRLRAELPCAARDASLLPV